MKSPSASKRHFCKRTVRLRSQSAAFTNPRMNSQANSAFIHSPRKRPRILAMGMMYTIVLFLNSHQRIRVELMKINLVFCCLVLRACRGTVQFFFFFFPVLHMIIKSCPLSLILLAPAKRDYSCDRRLHYEQFFYFHSESVGLVVFQVYSIQFQEK